VAKRIRLSVISINLLRNNARIDLAEREGFVPSAASVSEPLEA
jgi:hypothetical protein